MVKKRQIEYNSIEEIDNEVKKLKLDLAKHKGMLASKTKTNNTSKKGELKKQIARLLTKKNQLSKQTIVSAVEGKK